MRAFAAVTLLIAALLIGCTPEQSADSVLDPQAAPDEVLVALIDAVNAEDWETAYALYAEPEVDLATAVAEWEEAEERYEGFTVHEVRDRGETAEALVTYRVDRTLPGGQRAEVETPAQGEWWSLVRIDDRWFVRWLPRQ